MISGMLVSVFVYIQVSNVILRQEVRYSHDVDNLNAIYLHSRHGRGKILL